MNAGRDGTDRRIVESRPQQPPPSMARGSKVYLQLAAKSSLSSIDSVEELLNLTSSPSPRSASATPGRGVAAADDDEATTQFSSHSRRSSFKVLGRTLFVLSVVLLVAGVLLTVFGFGGDPPAAPLGDRLPMQIGGPVCLVTTVVTWCLGAIFYRLWTVEWSRQRQELELLTRVQIQAIADSLIRSSRQQQHQRSISLSPRELQESRLQRQMLLAKLRQQNAMDIRYIYIYIYICHSSNTLALSISR